MNTTAVNLRKVSDEATHEANREGGRVLYGVYLVVCNRKRNTRDGNPVWSVLVGRTPRADVYGCDVYRTEPNASVGYSILNVSDEERPRRMNVVLNRHDRIVYLFDAVTGERL